MCGFLGMAGGESPQTLLKAFSLCMLRLQHRGQESAGASWSDGHHVEGTKGMGLVPVVFDRVKLEQMLADNPRMIIGHTRYSTAGSSSTKNAQPHWLHDRRGRYAIALNGDVPDLQQLKEEAERKHGNVYGTENDAEFILKQINTYIDQDRPDWREDFIHGIRRMMQTTRATYSGGLITGTRLYVFRDPHENRPLFIGRRGSLFVAASETTVFDIIHADVEREVRGGEILVVEPNGECHSLVGVPTLQLQMCIFEYLYFSRPDSRCKNGETCARFRRRCGVKLVEHERSLNLGHCINCVMGVPDSGNFVADGIAAASGLPLRMGMVKDGYVGRTFIDPGADSRREKAERKYYVLPDVAAGVSNADGRELIPPVRSAIVAEDSIVRLTTLLVLAKKIAKSGLEEVHFRVSAPPIVSPCHFGIDMKTEAELIAANHTVEEIREQLGVASLLYLPLEKLDEVIREGGEDPANYCRKCFGAPCAI